MTEADSEVPDWSARQQAVAIVGWVSFLIASVATMFFFAFVDPSEMSVVTTPPLNLSRMAGYAVGFFFFWAISAGSGALCVYLMRTRPGRKRRNVKG